MIRRSVVAMIGDATLIIIDSHREYHASTYQFDADSVNYTMTPVIVPEPSDWNLLATGFALSAMKGRGRRN